MIQPRLAHRCDDEPVARQVDGVAVGLIDGGYLAPGKRAVERVARALAFQRDDELLAVLRERPSTASANWPSSSTCCSRERVNEPPPSVGRV